MVWGKQHETTCRGLALACIVRLPHRGCVNLSEGIPAVNSGCVGRDYGDCDSTSFYPGMAKACSGTEQGTIRCMGRFRDRLHSSIGRRVLLSADFTLTEFLTRDQHFAR